MTHLHASPSIVGLLLRFVPVVLLSCALLWVEPSPGCSCYERLVSPPSFALGGGPNLLLSRWWRVQHLLVRLLVLERLPVLKRVPHSVFSSYPPHASWGSGEYSAF